MSKHSIKCLLVTALFLPTSVMAADSLMHGGGVSPTVGGVAPGEMHSVPGDEGPDPGSSVITSAAIVSTVADYAGCSQVQDPTEKAICESLGLLGGSSGAVSGGLARRLHGGGASATVGHTATQGFSVGSGGGTVGQ